MASEEEFARQDEELVDLRFALRRADSELEMLRRERNLLRKELVMRESELERAREFLDRAHLLARAETAEAIADERLGRLQGLESALSKLRRKPSAGSAAPPAPAPARSRPAAQKPIFPTPASEPAPWSRAEPDQTQSPVPEPRAPQPAASLDSTPTQSATEPTRTPPAIADDAYPAAPKPPAAEQRPAVETSRPAATGESLPVPGFVFDPVRPLDSPALETPTAPGEREVLDDLADLPPVVREDDDGAAPSSSKRRRRFRDDLLQSRRALP